MQIVRGEETRNDPPIEAALELRDCKEDRLYVDSSGMVCLDSRDLNSRPNAQQLAHKAR